MSAELSTTIKYVRQIKKDSCISIISRCILHKLLIDIHESHYLRFARLYSLIIIRMLTNHTFALTTPSWNIKLLDKYYQMYPCVSTSYFRNIYQKHLSAVVSDYCPSKPLPNLQLLSIYFYLTVTFTFLAHPFTA